MGRKLDAGPIWLGSVSGMTMIKKMRGGGLWLSKASYSEKVEIHGESISNADDGGLEDF